MEGAQLATIAKATVQRSTQPHPTPPHPHVRTYVVGVNQRTNDAYVQAKKIDQRKDIITANEHPPVRDENILKTPNHGGRQRRVDLSALEDGQRQYKPKQARSRKPD